MYEIIPIIYDFDVLTFKPRKGYGCIYLYQLSSNKYYIGQTIQPLKIRHNQHMHNQYDKHTRYFDNALSCGKYSYILFIIHLCKLSDLDRAEQHYIMKYNSMYPNGYNLESGGSTCKYMSQYTRKKISDAKYKWAEEHYNYYKDFAKLMSDPQYLFRLHRPYYNKPMGKTHKANIKKALNAPEYLEWKNT